jgi:hypothetical protein
LSQSWGFKSQCWDWVYCIISNCPSSRGRDCVLQRMVKIIVSKRNI